MNFQKLCKKKDAMQVIFSMKNHQAMERIFIFQMMKLSVTTNEKKRIKIKLVKKGNKIWRVWKKEKYKIITKRKEAIAIMIKGRVGIMVIILNKNFKVVLSKSLLIFLNIKLTKLRILILTKFCNKHQHGQRISLRPNSSRKYKLIIRNSWKQKISKNNYENLFLNIFL